jgi:hypothetical protein
VEIGAASSTARSRPGGPLTRYPTTYTYSTAAVCSAELKAVRATPDRMRAAPQKGSL